MDKKIYRMIKSRFCYIIALLTFLTSCGSQSSSLQANQILYKDKVLTYNTTKIDDVFFDVGIDLELNKSNEVRCIIITNPDVITYNNISVGDKIEKVESKYQYEISSYNDIYVEISNGKEIDPTLQDESNDTIHIFYQCDDDGIITKIGIWDAIYGTTLK